MTNTKGTPKPYTTDQLRCAKSDWRSGLSAKEACRRHGVPVEVLERAITNKSAWKV